MEYLFYRPIKDLGNECIEDSNDKHALNALVDTVCRFAPDLVSMPPAPQSLRKALRGQAMWDVVATNKVTGKTLAEASV